MSILERSAMQVLEDALVKHSVLQGIALLEAEHGPDWAKKIDLETLELSSTTHCVLGQVYGDAEVTDEEAQAYMDSPIGGGRFDSLEDVRAWLNDGYSKGLAILDGALIEDRAAVGMHGFDWHNWQWMWLLERDDAELADLGVTRKMVQDARLESSYPSVYGGYSKLDEVWSEEIRARQARQAQQ